MIKHKKGLSDEETIEEIRENSYLQYFIGLSEFSYERVFDPSLFVTLRRRMGKEVFDRMILAFIERVEEKREESAGGVSVCSQAEKEKWEGIA